MIIPVMAIRICPIENIWPWLLRPDCVKCTILFIVLGECDLQRHDTKLQVPRHEDKCLWESFPYYCLPVQKSQCSGSITTQRWQDDWNCILVLWYLTQKMGDKFLFRASYILICKPNQFITVVADGPAYNNAKSSADTQLTPKWYLFCQSISGCNWPFCKGNLLVYLCFLCG